MNKSDTTIGFYRDKAGFTQKQLADMLGIPRTTMSFYENKRSYPDIKIAEKIAEIINQPIGKLFSEEELEVIKTKWPN